nr:hypothetical protein [Paenibacillus ginsengihumi]
MHFVQQFGRDELQSEEHRAPCCTFYNIEPLLRYISPFLLYKLQLCRLSCSIRLIGRPSLLAPVRSTDGSL